MFTDLKNLNPNINEAFTAWHEKQGDVTMNFKEEMINYGRSDVEVLARGVLKFR